jgi:hypothetical protein
MIKSIKTQYTPSLPSLPKRRRSYKANRDKVFHKILLPFIQAPTRMEDLEKIPFCNWSVPRIDDYGLACRIGQEYAAHFVQNLKDDPSMAPNNILADIARSINFDDDCDAKGYWVGFFTELSYYLMEGAQKIDVFKELDKRLVEAAKNCADDDEDIES